MFDENLFAFTVDNTEMPLAERHPAIVIALDENSLDFLQILKKFLVLFDDTLVGAFAHIKGVAIKHYFVDGVRLSDRLHSDDKIVVVPTERAQGLACLKMKVRNNENFHAWSSLYIPKIVSVC